MLDTEKNLIEELTRGFDNDPSQSARELDRLNDLCEKAAESIRTLAEVCDAYEKDEEKRNEDPFNVLNRINVNEHIEKKEVKSKSGAVKTLSYLSWAWAWQMLMQHYPDSYTSINRPPTGYPYWTDGKTAWVDVGVTIVWNDNMRTRNEVYPVLGYNNQSIKVDSITSFDINTALQRAWTKCIARHGLGFYIYAGEDLPSEEAEAAKAEAEAQAQAPASDEQIQKVLSLYNEAEIAKMLKRLKKSNPVELTAEEAQKMINKRDLSLVSAPVESF